MEQYGQGGAEEHINLRITYQEFRSRYQLLEILDRGAISLVRKAKDVLTGEICAVKLTDTTRFPGAARAVLRELEVLQMVEHKNCISMQSFCTHKNSVYIVVPLASGKILLDFLQEKVRLTELETAIIVHSLLQGVSYLHSKNVVHRDLKLENLMFCVPGDIHSLKILDYGFSKHLQTGSETLSTICGSPMYVAPEILKLSSTQSHTPATYTSAVDAWSTGVIIYMLLAGYAPFDEEDEILLFEKIIMGEYSFEDDPWKDISSLAKELVAGLLVVDPSRRMTVEQALNSGFIQMYKNAYLP